MKLFTLATVFFGILLIADHSVGTETVCNFSVVLKPGQIEKCEGQLNSELTKQCLNLAFGNEWNISLHEKSSKFKSATTIAKPGLHLCFGRQKLETDSHEIKIYRGKNDKTFKITGIAPSKISNILIQDRRVCGLDENGDLQLKLSKKLSQFLPVNGQISVKNFYCRNDAEFSLMGFRLAEPTVFCGFKAAKSTDFDERNTGFWHFVAENSGTLTYKE
ncbi:MAG: hypothetical protein U1E10_05395, partial [Bdellovibrionales bacterium]|nr:hypothetical protein [Bdellovibrionales bacterium]